jgi:hypothetical protein
MLQVTTLGSLSLRAVIGLAGAEYLETLGAGYTRTQLRHTHHCYQHKDSHTLQVLSQSNDFRKQNTDMRNGTSVK